MADDQEELNREFLILAARWADYTARQDNMNGEFRRDLRGVDGNNGVKGQLRDLEIKVKSISGDMAAIKEQAVIARIKVLEDASTARIKVLEDAAKVSKERGLFYWREIFIRGIVLSIIIFLGHQALIYVASRWFGYGI